MLKINILLYAEKFRIRMKLILLEKLTAKCLCLRSLNSTLSLYQGLKDVVFKFLELFEKKEYLTIKTKMKFN